MTLTAGTLLHQDRYKIQTVLTETNQGTAYRATDLQLEQDVVLQTPKIVAGETNGNGQMATSSLSTPTPEHFVNRVRHLVETQPPPCCCVLDTFLEANQPYIVLSVPIDEWTTLPSLQNWFLPTATSAPEQSAKQPDDRFEVIASVPASNLVEWHPTDRPIEPPAQDSPVQNGKVEPVPTVSDVADQNGKVENGKVEVTPAVNPALPATEVIQAIATQNGYSFPAAAVSAKPVARPIAAPVSQPKGRPRTPRWIPMGLVATSVIAGVAGATFGWALRHDSPTRPTQALLDPILNTDQNFPAVEGWPAEELPLPAPDVAPMEPIAPRYYEAPVLPNPGTYNNFPVDSPVQPKQETKAIPDTNLAPSGVPENPVDPTYVTPIPSADAPAFIPSAEQPIAPVELPPAAVPAPMDTAPAPVAPPPKAVPSPILQ